MFFVLNVYDKAEMNFFGKIVKNTAAKLHNKIIVCASKFIWFLPVCVMTNMHVKCLFPNWVEIV